MGARSTTCVLLASLMIIVLLSPLHCHAGRPVYDAWIVCIPPVPPLEAGWPETYHPIEYGNTLELCSLYWGIHDNLGCICTTNSGKPSCGHGAPQALLEAVLVPQLADGTTSFEEFCLSRCFCEPEADALTDRKTLEENSIASVATAAVAMRLSNSSALTINQNNSVTWHLADGDHVVDVYNVTPAYSFNDSATKPSDITNGPVANFSVIGGDTTLSTETCGSSCTTLSDCKSTEGCTCQTTSEQYVPAINVILFMAACMVTFGNDKRSTNVPCPCNSTYVSHGCCGILDGMVWEEPQAKLGQLVPLEL